MGLYTLVLYSTLTLAFDLYVSLYEQIGQNAMSGWLNAGFVVAGVVLLTFVLWAVKPGLSGYLAFLVICLVVAFCLLYLTVPAKRLHFLQYAPLTVLVFDAFRFRHYDHSVYVWTLFTVSLIGLGDETIQAFLPDRHFGIVDLVINSTAAVLTLAFLRFVLREENYPLPPKTAAS